MGAQAINVAARMPRRVAYFDVLNILATISVVWIHFGNEVHWYDGSKVWYWCLFIQVVCYWAVPVFFMLTGATLMNYQEKYSTKEFYLHRVKRSLLPYLVFGGILALCQVYKGDLVVDAAHPLLSILDIFMNNRMEPIYWFFPFFLGSTLPCRHCPCSRSRKTVNSWITWFLWESSLFRFYLFWPKARNTCSAYGRFRLGTQH